MKYTDEDLGRMKHYGLKTGGEMIIPYERKLEIYGKNSTFELTSASVGIRKALDARRNLDNEFYELDDVWKMKVLEENLEAILEVLTKRSNPISSRAST